MSLAKTPFEQIHPKAGTSSQIFFHPFTTTSQEESNRSQILQDPAPTHHTTIYTNPTTKTNTLSIRLAMVYLPRFILCGIIFSQCVFYYDLVENVIIGILKNGLECEFQNGNDCEFAELLYGLYRSTPNEQILYLYHQLT